MSTKQTPTEPARAMSDAELLRMQEADGRLRRYPQGEHASALSSMLADTEALEGVAEWLKQEELTVNVGAAIEPDQDVHIESSAGWLLRLVRTALAKQGTPDLTGARIAEQHIDRIRELEAEVAKLRAPVGDERAAIQHHVDLVKAYGDQLYCKASASNPTDKNSWSKSAEAVLSNVAESYRAALASAPVAGPSNETLRLACVIADKIEDGTLFQAGIFSRRELADKVRSVVRFAQQSAPVAGEAQKPVLCVSSADFKRLREADAHIKAWLPPLNEALDMALYAAPQASEAVRDADQDEMERRGWVNVGYKHDLEKARRAISFCNIPGFDTMSLDNAIYWLRARADDAAPQASADAELRAAFNEWLDKTAFIQKRIASGELPVKYLGWHRADIMRDLIEKAGNDARYERLEREHLGDADKGTGIYHPDNRPALCCGCQTCRPITLEDMRMVLCPTCGNKRCPHATDHRNACTGSNEPGQPGSSYGAPATLATMLLWLKRRMTWGMVSIPGAEVARLVGEIEALQRSQHDAGIEARARQLVADAAASGQVVRIDLVPRQPLAMGNLEMVVDVRAARHAPAPD